MSNVLDATESARQRVWVPVVLPLGGGAVAHRFVFGCGEAWIGRTRGCELMLDDLQVSRRHARIMWENHGKTGEYPRCLIEDCRSHNGTFVNNRRISRAYLNDGDQIMAGASILGFFIKDQHELLYDTRVLAQATLDGLTRVANRTAFEADAVRAVALARRHRRPLCLCAVDVDHLKAVNDTRGHAAGDAMLCFVAKVAVQSLRDSDLVGRLGGDEFAILLPETELPGAVAAMNTLRRRMAAEAWAIPTMDVPPTISVGVAQLKASHVTWVDLFAEADTLLYQAKKEGRDRVCSQLAPPDGTRDRFDTP
jgi:diguanylate cyclase (GGDEF)-like protein